VIPPALATRTVLVHDPVPFGGPLVGLVAALDACATPLALVIAGDMPRLVPAVLRRLAAAVGNDVAAATLEVPDRIQPLPMAIDVAAARRSGTRVLDRGGRSLRDFLVDLGAVSIPAAAWRALDPEGSTLVDVDEPGDLDR
jgi:molybdopterin-guanine dinucleotide biosynthesis protein A